MLFTDAVTVITGGGSGIGRALALALAAEGAELVIADIDEGAARAVAEQVRAAGRRALAVRCDVGTEPEIVALVERTLAEFGRIDCFVSNAGVLISGPIEQFTDADWRWIMDINFYAHVWAVRHVLPHMLARDSGRLVHVASAAGLIETGTNIPYHVSKHAVVALAGGLAIDLAARGSKVGVSVICPEVVNTNLPERSFAAGEGGRELTPDEAVEHERQAAVMKARFEARGLDPAEAARAIVAGLREDRHRIYTHARTHDIVVGRAQDPEQAIRDAVRVLHREQERMQRYADAARGMRD
jgi:NAD(P)-dependent dehydrogenase (short-subunit alcohol dehydrogenase family)